MGDENEGAAAEAGADALDEQTFSLGVEGGRRLIEQEDAAAASPLIAPILTQCWGRQHPPAFTSMPRT